MNKKYSTCDKCNKEINYGEPHVAIQRNVEHAEINLATNAVDVYISDSELLITLCNTCSELYNHDAVVKLIKAMQD